MGVAYGKYNRDLKDALVIRPRILTLLLPTRHAICFVCEPG